MVIVLYYNFLLNQKTYNIIKKTKTIKDHKRDLLLFLKVLNLSKKKFKWINTSKILMFFSNIQTLKTYVF